MYGDVQEVVFYCSRELEYMFPMIATPWWNTKDRHTIINDKTQDYVDDADFHSLEETNSSLPPPKIDGQLITAQDLYEISAHAQSIPPIPQIITRANSVNYSDQSLEVDSP